MMLATPGGPKKDEMMAMQRQQAPQHANMPAPEKGMGGQMMDMAKNRAMRGALNAGQKGITEGVTSAFAPSAGAAKAAALAANPATMGMGGAEVALAGQAMGGAGAGMAALGTAVPYIGAGLLAGKALGLFNEGGMVGPLSAQYKAQGGMTEEQARALMMNQSEPMPMPMARPDPDELYNEIMAESAQQAMPKMRPSATEMHVYNKPEDASMMYEGYDAILPPYTEDLPQYKAEGGSTGLLGLTTVGTNNSVSSTDSSMAGPLSNTTSFLPSYQGENTIISAAPLSEPVGFRQKNNETDTAISPSPTITTPEPVVTETAPRFDPALYDQYGNLLSDLRNAQDWQNESISYPSYKPDDVD